VKKLLRSPRARRGLLIQIETGFECGPRGLLQKEWMPSLLQGGGNALTRAEVIPSSLPGVLAIREDKRANDEEVNDYNDANCEDIRPFGRDAPSHQHFKQP